MVLRSHDVAMGVVNAFSNDVFISYSHIDNQSFGGDGPGWVDIFHAQLQNFVNVPCRTAHKGLA